MTAADRTTETKKEGKPPREEQVLSLVFAEFLDRALYRVDRDPAVPLTTPQLVALTYLQDNPGCTIKQLSRGTRVNHSAASQLVAKQAADGNLRTESNPADRRQARLRLTERGSTLLHEARASRLRALDRVLSRMTAEERERLVEGLRGFLRHALSSEQQVDDVCGRCWVEHFGDCIVNLAHRQLAGRDSKRVPVS